MGLLSNPVIQGLLQGGPNNVRAASQQRVAQMLPRGGGGMMGAPAPIVRQGGNGLGQGLASFGASLGQIGQMRKAEAAAQAEQKAIEQYISRAEPGQQEDLRALAQTAEGKKLLMQGVAKQAFPDAPEFTDSTVGVYVGDDGAPRTMLHSVASEKGLSPYEKPKLSPIATLRSNLQAGLITHEDFLTSVQALKRSGTTVNVNAPGQSSDIWGKPDSGYVWLRDENGEVMTETMSNGGRRPVQVPIAGGEADQAAVDSERSDELTKKGKQTQFSVLSDDISKARTLIEDGMDLPLLGNSQTGLVGYLGSFVPGSPQGALARRLDTIRANVGFDKLQQMREASPTGGALGSVSERENTLLQSVLGSLDQSNTREELLYNLDRLEGVYAHIIHGKGSERFGLPDRTNGAARIMDMSRQELMRLNPAELNPEELDAASRRYEALGIGQ